MGLFSFIFRLTENPRVGGSASILRFANGTRCVSATAPALLYLPTSLSVACTTPDIHRLRKLLHPCGTPPPLATSFGDLDLQFLVGVVLFGGEVEGHGGPPVFLVAESSR